MLYDTEFQEFWNANYYQMTPGAMTNAFMEVAYKAWLSAYSLGFDNGIYEGVYREKSQPGRHF